MNKILLTVNGVLVVAVGYLFYKSCANPNSEVCHSKIINSDSLANNINLKPKKIEQIGTEPTGKIAFINLDILNETSNEVKDLEKEAKSRRSAIEGSLMALQQNYEKEMMDYQNSAKAGIASEAELNAKAKKIQQIEKDAQNKQLQIDNLTMDIAEKNEIFQKNIKEFLLKWNAGKYDYILSYSESVPTMLLGNATLDITNQVVPLINEEYNNKKVIKK